MTKENKELLIKDLCARLPYGVKIKFNDGTDDVYNLDGNIYGRFTESVMQAIDDLELKPYLRPMESMTEEEKKIYNGFVFSTDEYGKICEFDDIDYLRDWLDANHFDHRGLIPKGLALVALEGMYNFK